MKDMPTVQPEGLVLDCYLPREDVRDAFVSPTVPSLADLPQGAVVGSSSLRRRAQLALRRPDLKLVEFRGNVQTRMKKLEDGVAVATFLAMAGLNRLGMTHVARGPIEVDEMLPAVAQGAIGIERRRPIPGGGAAGRDPRRAHRAAAGGGTGLPCALDGSCETPIAGLALLRAGAVAARRNPAAGRVGVDRRGMRGPVADGTELGRTLGDELLGRRGRGSSAEGASAARVGRHR
jgi:hydroxymethylbilane synthase